MQGPNAFALRERRAALSRASGHGGNLLGPRSAGRGGLVVEEIEVPWTTGDQAQQGRPRPQQEPQPPPREREPRLAGGLLSAQARPAANTASAPSRGVEAAAASASSSASPSRGQPPTSVAEVVGQSLSEAGDVVPELPKSADPPVAASARKTGKSTASAYATEVLVKGFRKQAQRNAKQSAAPALESGPPEDEKKLEERQPVEPQESPEEEGPAPAPSADEAQADASGPPEGAEAGDAGQEDVGVDEGIEFLRGSPMLESLRTLVRQDPSALQKFLESLTAADPDLMMCIARHQDDFMEMLVGDLEGPVKKEKPGAVKVTKPVKPRLSAKEWAHKEHRKLERALMPSTTTAHSLALRHSPYSCAVCKSMEDLMVCSACKSVRFCGRAHQRAFWPKHKRVCTFISGYSGGLCEELSHRQWMEDALPRTISAWTRVTGLEPCPWELEQLCHIPRCRMCGSFPATLLCPNCKYCGYCSESCRAADEEHRSSWQCRTVGLAALAAWCMHKYQGAMPYEVQRIDAPLSEEVYSTGWQKYVADADIVGQGTPFLQLKSVFQNTIIDSLSYPLTVMEALYRAGRPIEQLCARKDSLEVHIFSPSGPEMADLHKFEEWMNRGGSHLRCLTLRFIGSSIAEDIADRVTFHKKRDLSHELSAKSRERGRRMFVHGHTCSLAKWLDCDSHEAPTPDFRVAFAPAFGKYPAGHPAEWSPVLKRLAGAGDGVPFVVTETFVSELTRDCKQARRAGLRCKAGPMGSMFTSPLAVYDDVSSKEENPTGLLIWNMGLATFMSRSAEEGDDASSSSEETSGSEEATSEKEEEEEEEEQDEEGGEDLQAAIALSLQDAGGGEAAASASAGGRELEQPRGEVVAGADAGELQLAEVPEEEEEAKVEEAPVEEAGVVLASLSGPWAFSGVDSEDIPYAESNNPKGKFSVELEVMCTGGRGFRSPLTSRDGAPESGYMFYVDPEWRWAFWVGDGESWKGIRGPLVQRDAWTHLRGVVDPTELTISFYVDGTLAGSRGEVEFEANQRRPLRLGGGRSEREAPLFHFTGEVRNVIIRGFDVAEAPPALADAGVPPQLQDAEARPALEGAGSSGTIVLSPAAEVLDVDTEE